MPITLTLIENDHVLLYIFTDPWGIHELPPLYAVDDAHIEAANFKVHSLVDLSHSKQPIPQHALRARGKLNFTAANRGYIVLVGVHGLAQKLAEIIFQMVSFSQVKFFNNMDVALAFLHQSIDTE